MVAFFIPNCPWFLFAEALDLDETGLEILFKTGSKVSFWRQKLVVLKWFVIDLNFKHLFVLVVPEIDCELNYVSRDSWNDRKLYFSKLSFPNQFKLFFIAKSDQ